MHIDQDNKLHLLDTDDSRQGLQVYVGATFSESLIYSFNSSYVIDLNIVPIAGIAGSGIQVNARPFFHTDLEEFHIEVESKDQQNVFLFPEIGDEDPSSVALNITEGFNTSFMSMNLDAREV